MIRDELLTAPGVTKRAFSRRGTTVVPAGAAPEHVYLIETGTVKFVRTVNGHTLLVDLRSTDDLVGEEALVGATAYAYDAVIMCPLVVCAIPVATLRAACDSRPALWPLLLQYVLATKANVERRLEQLLVHDVRERLLYCLADLAALIRRARMLAWCIPHRQNSARL